MERVLNNRALKDRTILLSSSGASSELAIELERSGARVITGPAIEIPRSAKSIDPLPQALENAGARVDVVAAYRIASPDDSLLAQLRALLVGGGIDYIAFSSTSDVARLAQLFDTNDLSRPLLDVVVACIDQHTKQAAQEFGLSTSVEPLKSSIDAFVEAIQSFQNR